MRLRLMILSIVLISGAPAHAHTGPSMIKVTFSGAIPCAVACAHFVDSGFAPCENPFPPGSYADVLTSPAPEVEEGRVPLIEATLDPEVDWDSFLCESEPPYREIASGANILGEPCGYHRPLYLAIACHEDMSAPVQPGQVVIFRAYNWSDVAPATGFYWFLSV